MNAKHFELDLGGYTSCASHYTIDTIFDNLNGFEPLPQDSKS